MLELDSIHVENFLSYEKATLRFNRNEPTLVIGQNKDTPDANSNGSGKSALFEAILYGLFGNTTSGRHGDNAVKAFANNSIVKVEGRSNGKSFTITRYRKHDTHKNKLNFEYDGKPLEAGSLPATQALIEKVLEINFDLILQTCYFSPASIKTFCGMTDSEQKGIFQAILDLDKWEEALERVKAQEEVVAQEETKLNAELGVLKRVKARAANDLKDLLDSFKAIDTKDQEDVLREHKAYLSKMVNLESSYLKVRDALTSLRVDESNLEKEVRNLQQEQTAKKNLLVGECPTCKQPTNREVLEADLVALQNKAKEKQEQLKSVKDLLAKVQIKHNSLSDTLKHVGIITAEVKSLETFLASKQELKSDKLKRRNELSKHIADTNAQIKAKVSLLQFLAGKKELYKKLTAIFNATGARTYLIKQVLPILNKSLSEYSNLICPTITVQLAAQKKMTTKQIRNKFDIQVQSPVGAGYRSLSTGEAKRVDLCIVFAFLDLIRHLGKQTNFLILDEILDNLDQSGEDIAINQLKLLKQPNVFLVSHKSSLSARFSSVLVVEKHNHTSRILLDS